MWYRYPSLCDASVISINWFLTFSASQHHQPQAAWPTDNNKTKMQHHHAQHQQYATFNSQHQQRSTPASSNINDCVKHHTPMTSSDAKINNKNHWQEATESGTDKKSLVSLMQKILSISWIVSCRQLFPQSHVDFRKCFILTPMNTTGHLFQYWLCFHQVFSTSALHACPGKTPVICFQ